MIAALGLLAVMPWLLVDRVARRRCAALAGVAPTGCSQDARPPVDVTVVLELLGAALRAGAGVPRAIETVAQAVGGADGAALARVASALRLGAAWTVAWEGVPPRLDVVARALRPAWDEGAAPGEALTAAGEELRRARRDATRTAAGRLAVQLVLPLGTCFLPAFVLVGLAPVLLALGSGLLAG
ncbi:type II secretion system protein [Xylanimonas cellulosilytica DSM 15894]|uniref:Type II secretion system protein n=1 Tax=Xylanimonas cellulosilytica (strain DSM 15894 / JCM 12276 / CECT 5975 / KCTC 9989 / LMG 20990 / NBRC 107835 / XIL07) TaxID=446471 RepID=D1BV94_XYLCX|nr:type II secretion system F family protein [Xylanimonas cellulosilytica]ACZ29365.1 type II secretion system protein [Xylanimonas cellulosilytica DSM 15894]